MLITIYTQDVPPTGPTPEQAAEAQENRLKALRLRREELEHLLAQAKNELEAARSDGHNASQEYDSAQQAQKLADEEVETARKVCAEAYRVWLEAKERETATIRQASCAQDATGAALLRKQQADTRIWEVEQLQESTLAQKKELDRELAEDDGRRHQAELAESVRRMREMREVEEQERRERMRKEREAEQERQRRLREEEERLEREKREEARRKQEAEEYRLKLKREAAERAAREERENALKKAKAEEDRARRVREEAERIAREQEEKKRKAEEDRLWRQREEAERLAREESVKAALKKQKDEQGWIGWVGEKARQARDEAERIARELREYEEKRRKDEEDRLRRKREQDQKFERLVEESWEKVLKWRKAEERRKREEAERVAREQREEALKKQKEEEEKQRRLREEAERVAREQRKKEEAERRAAEARQRLYDEALAKEIERCRERDDTKFCPTTHVVIWDEWRALARYMYIGSEFDRVQWSDARPLTFGSVPWPVLGHPENVNFETITWTAVERFFKSMERVLGRESSEYEVLVVKTQVRFHPDRWRARRVLGSVWDGELREKLEEAGNVVAQAVTPLRARGSK